MRFVSLFFHNIFSNKKFLKGFLFFVLGIFILDQSTKFAAQKAFLNYSSSTTIHDYQQSQLQIFHLGKESHFLDFSLTYVRNTGSAWGFLGNLPESIRPYFFGIFTFLALCFILYLIFDSQNHFIQKFALTVIFAGAFGNFVDRVHLRYVIDMIHFQWSIFGWFYDYPVFNIADSCVTIGVVTLFFDVIFSKKNEIKK